MQELNKILKKYRSLTQDMILNYEKFNFYSIVHHSSSIEGSTLTPEETTLLLDENLTPNSKPLAHTYMVLDHYEALKYLMSVAKEKKPLSEDIIKNTASLIMKNTGGKISAAAGDFDSSKGDYRKLTVRAGNTAFPYYKKVPGYTNELLTYINNRLGKPNDFENINKLAFSAHYQMVSIHPFADGNGRISRLLMNYVQQYHNVPLSIIYSEDKQEYYRALEKTRENEDIEIFYEFMFSQTEKYLKGQIKILENRPKKKKNSKGFSFLY